MEPAAAEASSSGSLASRDAREGAASRDDAACRDGAATTKGRARTRWSLVRHVMTRTALAGGAALFGCRRQCLVDRMRANDWIVFAQCVRPETRPRVARGIGNHRSVAEILDYVRRLGALVGAADKANAYADELRRGLDAIEAESARLMRRPRVYFEEWDEPPITGIRWVAELVRIAGGDDVFPERALEPLAKARILEDGDEVIRRAPDIILGSWCGKKFRPGKVAARPGWDAIPAVRDGELHEIKSPLILQPGPAALTDGVRGIAKIVRDWASRHP